MKKRNILVTAGLMGILGFGYFKSRYFLENRNARTSTISVSEMQNDEDIGKSRKKSLEVKLIIAGRDSSIEEEVDRYREQVNNLDLIPHFFYEPPVISDLEYGCDEEEIKSKHEEAYQKIIYNNDEHALWRNMDYLILLDAQLANCKYKDNPEKFKEFMLEIAEHLESTNRLAGVGRVYYALGEVGKARGYFLLDKDSIEEAIKVTPKEDLPALVQNYLKNNNLFAAGKVEWFQGNREQAEILIRASEQYKQLIQQSKNYIRRGQYKAVINALWHLLVPFYKKIMLELCDDNVQCQEAINNYDPWEKFSGRID